MSMSRDLAEVNRRDACAARELRVQQRERERRIFCTVATLDLAHDLPRLPRPLAVRIVKLAFVQQHTRSAASMVDLTAD